MVSLLESLLITTLGIIGGLIGSLATYFIKHRFDQTHIRLEIKEKIAEQVNAFRSHRLDTLTLYHTDFRLGNSSTEKIFELMRKGNGAASHVNALTALYSKEEEDREYIKNNLGEASENALALKEVDSNEKYHELFKNVIDCIEQIFIKIREASIIV